MRDAHIVIVGATGEVGRALLTALEDSSLALQLSVLASAAREDETVMFRGSPLLLEAVADFDFSAADIAVFAVPAEVAALYVPRARAAGCRVIDHSAYSRAQTGLPLILAGDTLPQAEHVACPSALAAMLAPALEAVDVLAGLESAEAVVLQPASVAGRAGMRELAGQTGELLNARGIEPAVFPLQLAFNTLPAVGSEAENALMDELERLLEAQFPLALAEVLVPVFYGQTVALSLRTTRDIPLDALAKALQAAGLKSADNENNQGVATPVTDAAGVDAVFFCGLRPLPAPLQGVGVWLVADNLCQGAVRHSLYILENWIKRL